MFNDNTFDKKYRKMTTLECLKCDIILFADTALSGSTDNIKYFYKSVEIIDEKYPETLTKKGDQNTMKIKYSA
jgi:hypothetical protein